MKPKRINIQKDILFIFISSFIVVAAWIGFNIYHIWATSTVSQNLQLELTPISPLFDPETIQQLKTRENIQPLYESKIASPLTPTPAVQNKTVSASSPVSGISSVTTQNTTASNASQLEQINSPINRLGK